MDKQKRSRRTIISTGTTSIVLIFVMLSLLTFAVLSLVSAQADLRLSRKSAERTTAYYDAENAANAILIDLLRTAREDPQALADDLVTEDGLARYEVPLGEDQLLAVEAVLPIDGREFQITRWQAVSRYDWSPDDSLHLFDPSGLPAG